MAPAAADCPPGVIFVLKNRNGSVNRDKQNRLHPFYLVYVDEAGQVVCDYLNPKRLLDKAALAVPGRGQTGGGAVSAV